MKKEIKDLLKEINNAQEKEKDQRKKDIKHLEKLGKEAELRETLVLK